MAAFKKKSYPRGARPSKQVSKILIKTSARFECLEDDTFACALCTGKFITVAELLHHHLRMHQDDWHYWCNICDHLVGISPNQLNQHIMSHPVNDMIVSDTGTDPRGNSFEKIRKSRECENDCEESDDIFREVKRLFDPSPVQPKKHLKSLPFHNSRNDRRTSFKNIKQTEEIKTFEEESNLSNLFEEEKTRHYESDAYTKDELSQKVMRSKVALPTVKKSIAEVSQSEEENSQGEISDAESLEFNPFQDETEDSNDDKDDDIRACNKAVYCCSFCTETFASLLELINHTKSYHDKKEPAINDNTETFVKKLPSFSCSDCRRTYSTVGNYRRHIKSCGKSLQFNCPRCTTKFDSMANLKTHFLVIHNGTLLKCGLCQKCVPKDEFKEHFTMCKETKACQLAVQRKVFNCDFCKQFSSRSKLRLTKHIARHLEPASENKTPHSCTLCGKTFAWLNSLRIHIKYHTNELPFICDICTSKFPSKHLLAVHIRRVHCSERLHKCAHCSHSYKTGRNLRLHMVETHGWTFEHQCTICDYPAPNAKCLSVHNEKYAGSCLPVCKICGVKCKRGVLKRHERAHVEKHECPMCPQKFARKDSLNDHLNTHKGVRPYECEKCKKTFSIYYTYYSHKRSDCGKVNVQAGKVQPIQRGGQTSSNICGATDDGFKCGACEFQSKTKGAVYAHFKCKHTDYGTKPKPVFECKICGKFIRKKDHFENHLNAHMGLQPYECQGCPKKFGSRLSLYQHATCYCPANKSPKPSVETKAKQSKAPVAKGMLQIHSADRMYVLVTPKVTT